MDSRASVAAIKRAVAAKFPEEAEVVDAQMEYFATRPTRRWRNVTNRVFMRT